MRAGNTPPLQLLGAEDEDDDENEYEAHHDRFWRTNRRGSGSAGLGFSARRAVRRMVSEREGRPKTGRLMRSIRLKKRLRLLTFRGPNGMCVIVTLLFCFRLTRP